MTQQIATLETTDSRPRTSILYVEDHDDTRRAMERLFVRQGFNVEVAKSCADARARAAKMEHLDLLISDIELPDGTGYELLQSLIGLRPELCAIALTGFGLESDVARAMTAGFNKHLTKPLQFDLLLDTIAELTGTSCR